MKIHKFVKDTKSMAKIEKEAIEKRSGAPELHRQPEVADEPVEQLFESEKRPDEQIEQPEGHANKTEKKTRKKKNQEGV